MIRLLVRRADVDRRHCAEIAAIRARARAAARRVSLRARTAVGSTSTIISASSKPGARASTVSLVVDHERVAVEDELVLAADGVAERDVGAVVACARLEHLLALAIAEQVERRRGDVHEQLGAGEREIGRRRARLPHVLADRDADERLAVLEEVQLVARREVAHLVEDAVVRQEALLHHRLHLAAGADRAGVVEVAVEVRRADEDDDPARRERDLLERPLGGAEKAGPEQQILGRIAGHRELGEDDEVGVRPLRLLDALDDQRAVPVEVADDRVDLGQRETHRVSDYQS